MNDYLHLRDPETHRILCGASEVRSTTDRDYFNAPPAPGGEHDESCPRCQRALSTGRTREVIRAENLYVTEMHRRAALLRRDSSRLMYAMYVAMPGALDFRYLMGKQAQCVCSDAYWSDLDTAGASS